MVANNSKYLGGVLFKDSADKAAKFISICDAYGLPLLFLADVPGFMIGSKVEREGIIRHGAKMLHAMASASVPWPRSAGPANASVNAASLARTARKRFPAR